MKFYILFYHTNIVYKQNKKIKYYRKTIESYWYVDQIGKILLYT